MTQTATASDSTCNNRPLYIGIDMGRDSWHLALGDARAIRDAHVDRKNLTSAKDCFLAEIAAAKERFGVATTAPVHVVYEAGRDGFWFARWLRDQGFECVLVDPAAILVDRKAKRRKNDIIDARALLDLLIRHVTGDRVLQPVLVPPLEAEDARQLGRLARRLAKTRRSLATRLQSLLWRQGIDWKYARALPDPSSLRTGDGRSLGPALRQEVEILCRQIVNLDGDICRLEDERTAQIRKPETPTQQLAHDLERLVGIGPVGSWTLAHELFGWREFKNAKKLGAFVGLSPMPFCSGTMDRDQGISKAGPGPIRALMVELAWDWLRYQPDSDLSKWYQTRFGETAKRSRRVGIVALARKLLVALWRYVTRGVIPGGARTKPDRHRAAAYRPCGVSSRPLAARLASV